MECRSIRINAPGEVEIIRTEIPAPGKDEALLKVLYGGICGSDLGSYRGTFAYFDYPRIPGHEFSAEIVEIDEENAYGLKKGMIVTCNPYYNCGKCYSCQRGLVNCCEHNETLGCQRDGAFSDYVVMPLERIYDGKGLPARTLALIEPFCISYHGVKRADLKAGDKVLVTGAGTIAYCGHGGQGAGRRGDHLRRGTGEAGPGPWLRPGSVYPESRRQNLRGPGAPGHGGQRIRRCDRGGGGCPPPLRTVSRRRRLAARSCSSEWARRIWISISP